jgi:LmbE family N-acetylglucosaminyl deacetylase
VTAVILSPHLDDAALSAGDRIMQDDLRVVTVFAGPPPAAVTLTQWDRLCAARSSAQRHEERLAEDDAAMALLGRRGLRLDLPERQYRTAELDRAQITARLEPLLGSAAEVWLPAGIGGHPDHIEVREIVLGMIGPASRCVLYADLPYAIRHGWPAWVTGEPPQPYLDADFWLSEEMARCGLQPRDWTAETTELPPERRRRKEAVVSAYRSQLAALRLDPADGRRWAELLRYELCWTPAR